MNEDLFAPPGSSALLAAVEWLQGTLLGTLATTVAIIAVAAIGFELLTGRIDVRRGLTKIVGCFLIFGASGVVAGLQATATSDFVAVPAGVAAPSPLAVIPPSAPYDPYAGASVPTR